MFFAAIHSPLFPFVPKFPGWKLFVQKFAALKNLRTFVKPSVPKFTRMPTHPAVKIFVQRLVRKSAATFSRKFARMSSPSFL